MQKPHNNRYAKTSPCTLLGFSWRCPPCRTLFFFFFNDTAPTEIYPLSLHDALPISSDLPLDADGAYPALERHPHIIVGLTCYRESGGTVDGHRIDLPAIPCRGYGHSQQGKRARFQVDLHPIRADVDLRLHDLGARRSARRRLGEPITQLVAPCGIGRGLGTRAVRGRGDARQQHGAQRAAGLEESRQSQRRAEALAQDRKSTRLNSSHLVI